MNTGAIKVDNRIGGDPRYYFSDTDEPLVNVPDEIRKCVVFLGRKRVPTDNLTLSGTAFLLSVMDRGIKFSYVVTAAHVLEGIAERGHDDVYIRINAQGGGTTEVRFDLKGWKFHSDRCHDVAVHHMPFRPEFDCLVYPSGSAATPAVFADEKMGVGDEVFMAGLYTRHAGRQRNVPIIRIGTIAAMPEEPCMTNRGPVAAYLVEIRSIGGISGSPVFIRPFPVKFQNGLPMYGMRVFYLLGLMHGKWDMKQLEPVEFEVEADPPSDNSSLRFAQPLNSGIGVVVPVERILEVLNHADLVAARDQSVRERDARESTTPD